MAANAAHVGPITTTAIMSATLHTPMVILSLTRMEKISPRRIKLAKTIAPTSSRGSSVNSYQYVHEAQSRQAKAARAATYVLRWTSPEPNSLSVQVFPD